MRKLNLTDWASISEIVGTLAVVVSLIFVVLSIDRNTQAMQVTNENFLYELTDSSLESVMSDPELSATFVRAAENTELSEVEQFRLGYYFTRMMNRWNLAFDRYQDGMFAPEKWAMWNKNYVSIVDKRYLQEWWARNKAGYGTEFSAHIESVISAE
jgi:hypothetical protein